MDFKKLYVITDRHRCAPTPLTEVISELLDAGVTAIQLREKDLNSDELMDLAQPIVKLCRNYKAKLFINTDTRVARNVGAAGVHLPAYAKSVSSVKAQKGDDFAVGCSVHSFAAAEKREAEGADFLTYSPIYPTASKPGYGPAVGVENLAQVVQGALNYPSIRFGRHYTGAGFCMSGSRCLRSRCDVRRYGSEKCRRNRRNVILVISSGGCCGRCPWQYSNRYQ